MDFISADRSRDQEHTAELKNYNFGVVQHNADITRAIKEDRDTEKKQKQDIESGETFTQIKDAGGEAGALGQAVATFKKIKQAQEAGKTALGSLQDTISTAGEKAQNLVSKSKSAVPEVELGEEVSSGVYESTTKAPSEIASSATRELEAGAEGIGSKALKGLGGVGAVAGMGMAIASDANGGWAKKSLSDKIGNVAEIGGAGLDLLGLGLEATGVGAPLGLVLQGIGTLAQVGSGIEESISAQQSVKPAEDEATKEEQQAEASEKSEIQQTETAVSGAGAGSLGVARQQQN
jgi:hypothetical protein